MSADELIGRSLGGYYIRDLLGEGGMASVYRAERQSDGEVVAIKVMARRLNVTEQFVKRFQREARLMASFNHPNILPVYDFGQESGYTYLAMKLLEGGNLRAVSISHRMIIANALAYLTQIGNALDYAHQRGVTHRDLKPANVLLDMAGNTYLADFGIAKFREESVGLTATGMIMGTPSYMAPEQWRTEPVDQRTDIYAFGVMIFEILTGKLPFEAENPFSLMYRHLDEPPPAISKLRDDVPKTLDRVLWRAMAKVPERRYPTAGAVVLAIEEAIQETREVRRYPDQTPPTLIELDNFHATEATLDEPTVTDANLMRPPVSYDARTVTDQNVFMTDEGLDGETILQTEGDFVTRLDDDHTVTPDAVDLLEGHTVTVDEAASLHEEMEQYNAVDVGARALLSRAREAAQELDGDEAVLAQAVVEYVQDLREQAKQKPNVGQSPYRALESYDIGDNKLFYGREVAIQAMLDRSPFARFTVLHAESGAGKTSLLRAGIMPRLLAGGYLPLYVAVRRRAPHEAIKHVLIPDESLAPELAMGSLRAYLKALTRITGSNREIFIFIDQFETFFTDVFSDEDRADFVSEIAEVLDDELLPVRITLGMRTEYFGLLASFQPAIPHPFENEFLLRSLGYDEARRALTLPAQKQGYRFENEAVYAVLDDLKNESGEIAPPQLQLVGGALIDALPESRKTITLDDYVNAGKAEGVLRGYLERLLNRFSPEQRQIARRIIENLVRADQTRDVRSRDKLVSDLAKYRVRADEVDEVIHALRENRVLRVVELDDELAYELVHDYLALQVQLDPETIARKAAQELLDRRIGDYQRYGSLLTEQELNVISPQLNHLTLTPDAHNLVSDTRARLRRQRRIAIGLGSAAILGVIGVLALAFIGAVRESQNRQKLLEQAQTSEARIAVQRDIALAGQVSLQGLLELDENRVDNALLLGVEAMHITDTREARSSLLTTLETIPQLKTFLYGHSDWIRAVAYSPDGTSFASASADHHVIIWDAETLQPTALEGHTAGVWSVAYSPDGTLLASAGDDGQILLWDAASHNLLETLGTFENEVISLAFSPDGRYLVSGHGDNLIRVWDVSSRQMVQELEGHTDWVFAVTFSPDGKMLASGGRDNLVMLWDVGADGKFSPAQTLSGHTNWVFDVAFNHDGTVLASVAADGTLRLWDVATGEPLGQPITDHTDWVRSVEYSPDGTILATGSRDDTIILRDAASGRRLPEVAPLRGHPDEVFGVAFSPDGATLVSGDEAGKLLVWNVNDRQPLSRVLTGHTNWVNSLVYSPDGTRIFSGGNDAVGLLFDVDSGRPVQEPFTAEGEILSVVFDGRHYAYGGVSGQVVLGELGGKTMTISASSPAPVRTLALSPDGKMLASGGDDALIRLWNVPDGSAVREPLAAHDDWVMTLVFSPDGKMLASGGQDRQIMLWNTSTWQIEQILPLTHTDGITVLRFNQDGSQLVSGSRDGTIIVWDVASGEMVGQPFVGHTSWVLGLDISPDGQMLASGGRDDVVILWDMATGRIIGQPLTGHAGWIWTVAFSPDGKSLATGSQDNTIRIWDVDPVSWQARACAITNRDMATAEWVRYLPDREFSTVCASTQ